MGQPTGKPKKKFSPYNKIARDCINPWRSKFSRLCDGRFTEIPRLPLRIEVVKVANDGVKLE
jgi:hypothetical protein